MSPPLFSSVVWYSLKHIEDNNFTHFLSLILNYHVYFTIWNEIALVLSAA